MSFSRVKTIITKETTRDVLTIITMGYLAFGTQILWLGYFQDDWNFVYFSSTSGARGIFEFLVADGRPGASWVYWAGFFLLGYKPGGWQFFSISLRILTAINFWFVLRNLWPSQRFGNLIVSVIFLTYPFFTLQPLSLAYAPHFAAYFLFSLSLWLMMLAIKRSAKYLQYSIPALISTFLHLFTVEYFIGLELLRPILIWLALKKDRDGASTNLLRDILRTWLPYLLATIFFIYWRSKILVGPGIRHDPLEMFLDSGRIFITTIQNVAADLALMLVSTWFELIRPELFVIGPIRNLYFWVIALSGAATFFLLSKAVSQDDDGSTSNVKGRIFLGVYTIAIGMIAPYAGGYIVHLKLAPWNGRFALPALFGLALAAAGGIELIVTDKKVRHAVISILVGLLVGLHNYNTLEFKSAWEKQERFYQQLIWRAPMMKVGTSIITGEEVMSYMGDYPTSFGINVVYGAKPQEGISPPYWFFALSENFKGSAEAVTSSAQLEASKPPIFFHGNSMDAIYITYEPGMMQCLWVLRAEDAEYKYLPAEMKKAALVSSYRNVQRNVNTDYRLYRQIVDEDKNTWCYYYEKADLARQYGDWNTVLRLWEEAQQNGYRPGNGFEYLPFIEAYIRMGDWENAFRLTKTANKITEAMYFVLCPTWERLAGETPPNAQKDLYLPKAYDLLRCVPQN